jgi:hypothetical protein
MVQGPPPNSRQKAIYFISQILGSKTHQGYNVFLGKMK